MKRTRFVQLPFMTAVLYFVVFSLGAQEGTMGAAQRFGPAEELGFGSVEKDARTALAMTAQKYPVTPGDTYQLNFIRAGTLSSQTAYVQSDYTINMAMFGIFNGRGKTFLELKNLVEEKVSLTYRDSLPQMVILSTGTFQVLVTGEVKLAGLYTAWGMSRISEAFKAVRTDYSSERQVTVRGSDGRTRQYDLFSAHRRGNLDENPFIEPGSRLELRRADRSVTIEGQVRRPGTYQLLPHDTLETLIENYADGFTERADRERVRLVRFVGGDKGIDEARILDLSRTLPAFELQNLDMVRIPSIGQRSLVVYLEGALLDIPDAGESASTKDAGPPPRRFDRIRHAYVQGDHLYSVVSNYRQNLHPQANLREAFIVRENVSEPIPVNLERLLFNFHPDLDVELRNSDRIVIPYGIYEIYLTGEVANSSFVEVESLKRLDQVIQPYLTAYSSIRDIKVTSLDGSVNHYDLFKSRRYGEREQNPYLQPGDRIVVNRYDRSVTIEGQVRRPGTYQLLPHDTLETLIENYADGFTPIANPSKVSITRFISEKSEKGDLIYLDLSQRKAREVNLHDKDKAFIHSQQEMLPVVFFEGAIRVNTTDSLTTPEGANRVRYSFIPGTRLSTAIFTLRDSFTQVSDLANAYIRRKDREEPIAVNIEKFLYNFETTDDIMLENGDYIIIPFRQYFISVAGAVIAPGRYAYVPNRTWKYYVNLAGGLDYNRNTRESLSVFDKDDRMKPKESFLDPEDRIFVESNDFVYNFNRWLSLLGSVASVVTAVIGIMVISGF